MLNICNEVQNLILWTSLRTTIAIKGTYDSIILTRIKGLKPNRMRHSSEKKSYWSKTLSLWWNSEMKKVISSVNVDVVFITEFCSDKRLRDCSYESCLTR